MHSFLQQYQEVFLTLLKMKTKLFERIPFFRVYINLYVRAKRIGIGIFYPMGELISLHRLRCNPFAVYKYSFMGYYLAAAVISTRE